MAGNRARKSVRQSRALGIALTPKAEKYCSAVRIARVNMGADV